MYRIFPKVCGEKAEDHYIKLNLFCFILYFLASFPKPKYASSSSSYVVVVIVVVLVVIVVLVRVRVNNHSSIGTH
jgi:hypothetical protein